MSEFLSVPPEHTEISSAVDLYDTLLEELEKEYPELALRWDDELQEKIESGELTPQEAYQELCERKRKRKHLETTGYREESLLEQEGTAIEGIAITLHYIRQIEANPDRFLGNGSVANVASLGDGTCVKVIHNYERYAEGNSIHTEAQFLLDVQDITIEGVRSPRVYQAISGHDTLVIIMEELDAACLARVIEGHDELPAVYQHDDFFQRLGAYFDHLHTQDIYHRDVALRNIMVDRKTGLPYVIDFGKSQNRIDIMGEHYGTLSEINAEKDRAGLAQARARMAKFIETAE